MFDFVDNFTCFIAFGEMTYDLMTAPQSWPFLTLLGGTWLFAVGAMWGQTFTDGDPSGILYTEHVGGYLGHGVSFADFNADGNDDLTFTQFEGQILAFAGDGLRGVHAHGFGNRQHGWRTQVRAVGRF